MSSQSSTFPDLSQASAPGLPRRLATMLYDLLLLAGVLVVAAALVSIPLGLLGVDLTHGLPRFGFQVYLLGVIVWYYVFFWIDGRQTLGMRAWRTLLLRADGQPLGTGDALRRFAFAVMGLAPAGLGLWWSLFDPAGLTWYDRMAGTRAVLLAKPGRPRP